MRLLLRARRPEPVVPHFDPLEVYEPSDDARDRAELLLMRHCTSAQVATWKTSRYICVRGSRGGRFCLHDLYGFCRVFEHDDRQVHTYVYCSYLAQNHGNIAQEIMLPIGDQILAHKLCLEASESGFRITAPRSSMAETEEHYAHPRHRHG